MTRFQPGERLVFKVGDKPLDTSEKDVRYVLTRMRRLGLILEHDDQDELTMSDINDFAAKTPISSRSVYLGTEHFRSLNVSRGLNARTGSRLFSRLVDPQGEIENKKSEHKSPEELVDQVSRIKKFYEDHDIDVTSRIAAGLPIIPYHLQRATTKNVDDLAIRADSVLEIAKNQNEFIELVPGLGQMALKGIDVVSSHILESIKAHRRRPE